MTCNFFSRPRFHGRCFECGEKGHIKIKCDKWKPKNGGFDYHRRYVYRNRPTVYRDVITANSTGLISVNGNRKTQRVDLPNKRKLFSSVSVEKLESRNITNRTTVMLEETDVLKPKWKERGNDENGQYQGPGYIKRIPTQHNVRAAKSIRNKSGKQLVFSVLPVHKSQLSEDVENEPPCLTCALGDELKFEVGENVYVKDGVKTEQGKVVSIQSGPYTVVEQTGPANFQLSKDSRKERNVHVSRIRSIEKKGHDAVALSFKSPDVSKSQTDMEEVSSIIEPLLKNEYVPTSLREVRIPQGGKSGVVQNVQGREDSPVVFYLSRSRRCSRS